MYEKRVNMILVIWIILVFLLSNIITVSAALPEQPEITFLNKPNTGYKLGDTVKILVEGEAAYGGEVYEFECRAYYDSTMNTEYHAYKLATQLGGSSYKCEFEFALTDGYEKTLTIEVRSYDGDHNLGGLPSLKKETAIYVYSAESDDSDEGDDENVSPGDTNNQNPSDGTPGFGAGLIFIIISLAVVYRLKKQHRH